MALQKKLDAFIWILQNARLLQLEVKRFKWIDTIFSNYHDYRVSIKIDGKVYSGRGSDSVQEVAILKGFSEALESYLCHHYRINSCGLSVHLNEEDAKEIAYKELVERDVFFTHFVNAIPFKEFHVNVSKELSQYLLSEKLSLKYFTTPINLPEEMFFCLCVINSWEAGGTIGLSVSNYRHSATETSLIEALRSAAAYRGKSMSSINLEMFDKIESPKPSDHCRLAWDADYWRRFSKIFFCEASDICTEYVIGRNIIKLQFEAKELRSSPFVAFKASCEKVQLPFYGRCLPTYINPARKYTNSDLSMLLPHPLG